MPTEQNSREQIIRHNAALGHDRAMCAAIAGCRRSEVDRVLDGNLPEPMPRMITLPLHRRPHSDQQKLKIREPRYPKTLRSRLERKRDHSRHRFRQIPIKHTVNFGPGTPSNRRARGAVVAKCCVFSDNLFTGFLFVHEQPMGREALAAKG